MENKITKAMKCLSAMKSCLSHASFGKCHAIITDCIESQSSAFNALADEHALLSQKLELMTNTCIQLEEKNRALREELDEVKGWDCESEPVVTCSVISEAKISDSSVSKKEVILSQKYEG